MGCCGQDDELQFLEQTLPWDVVALSGVCSAQPHPVSPGSHPRRELWGVGGEGGADLAFPGFLFSSKTITVFSKTNRRFTPSGAASSSGLVRDGCFGVS